MGLFKFLGAITDPNGSYRREVAGTPKGGQFAAGYHHEVAIILQPREEAMNADGYWEAPAYPTSAAALIDFWMNVPVPEYVVDHVLANVPDADHAETARMLARLEKVRQEMQRLSDDERTKVVRHPFHFPDGRYFAVYDGLKYWGCNTNANMLPAG